MVNKPEVDPRLVPFIAGFERVRDTVADPGLAAAMDWDLRWRQGSPQLQVVVRIGSADRFDLDELLRLVRGGAGLVFGPSVGSAQIDLGGFRTLLREVEWVEFDTDDVVGWEALHDARSLVVLKNAFPPRPVALEGLPSLRRAEIRSQNTLSLLDNPNLRSLTISEVELTGARRIAAPLTVLRVVSVPQLADLTLLTDTSQLRSLLLKNLPSFDLGSLTSARSLQRLDIANVGALSGIATLDELEELSSVRLQDIQAWTPRDWSPTGLRASELVLHTRGVLTDEQVRSLNERDGWVVDDSGVPPGLEVTRLGRGAWELTIDATRSSDIGTTADLEHRLVAVLLARAPKYSVTCDSDSDTVRLVFRTRREATAAMEILADEVPGAWT